MNIKISILKAIKKTKNTTQKKSQILSLPEILKRLSEQLKSANYQPSRFSCFAVEDPKIREIFAPAYIDRIIHHILIDSIGPNIDRTFIFDSYANRKNKGIHKATSRLQKFLQKNNTLFYLQADVKTFFPSIDKKILNRLLIKHIKHLKKFTNQEKSFFLDLAQTIVWHNPIVPSPVFTGNKQLLKKVPSNKSLFFQPPEKGLPIGSLTSQFFANLYLNELDQFIKHELKVKYYLRYVDDFILLAENPKILNNYLIQIENFLDEKLKLELNPSKTILQPSRYGINFLGYICRKNYLLVRKRSIKSFKRNLYFFNHLIDPQKFPVIDPPNNSSLGKAFKAKTFVLPIEIESIILNKMLATINSYYGTFIFANTFKLRQSLYEKHFHHLKEYFERKDNGWKAMKIKKAFK